MRRVVALVPVDPDRDFENSVATVTEQFICLVDVIERKGVGE
jgi:hypothetical protein